MTAYDSVALMRGVVCLMVLAIFATARHDAARAQTPEQPPQPTAPEQPALPGDRPRPEAIPLIEAADLDAPFGPARTIEAIRIEGARVADHEDIRAVLQFAPGETLAAGDSALRDARLRVLSLGMFRDATIQIAKGTRRGAIIVIIQVTLRPTWSLNRLWVGSSHSSHVWLGGEVEKKNVWRRIDVAGAGLIALGGGIVGDGTQWAAELRATKAPYLTVPFGWQFAMRVAGYHEPIRLSGDGADRADDHFTALAYRHTNTTFHVLWDIDGPTRLRAGPVLGSFHTATDQLPALTRELDGVSRPIDLGLLAGTSLRMAANVGIEFDWRDHPLNPREGFFADLDASVMIDGLDGDYAAVKLVANLEHWVPFAQKRRALGLLGQAYLILGAPPRLDRVYVNDLYGWLPSRALGAMLATRAPFDLLGSNVNQTPSGDQAAAFSLRYAQRIVRKRGFVQRGDLFVSAGAFVLRDTKQVNGGPAYAFPVGLMYDVGMRLETRWGIAELSLANLGSRLP